MTKSPTQSVVVFEVEGRRFALHTAVVVRVHRAVDIAPLPGAPDGVRGVINVHGAILPVYDLHRQLGLPERPVRLSDHLLVARTAKRIVVVLADSVGDVLECPAALFTPVAGLGADDGPAVEILKLDGDIIFVHDLDRFLSEADQAALQLALEAAR